MTLKENITKHSSKYKRPFKNCEMCGATVTRLDQHLKRKHSIEQEKAKQNKNGITKVTIARNCNILERVLEEKNIGTLKNVLNEYLIKKMFD